MSRLVVILHGWSDSFSSFRPLANLLKQQLGASTHVLKLADWRSMDDEVTYADLAHAMEAAWQRDGLPTAAGSVDLVVHSTGALVAREWMTIYHSPGSVPIKRFLMLAPANFGSPLAHKGYSFIGRAVKGWNSGLQTGKKLLTGLELASPYTWKLAERDLFVDESDRWYGAGRILSTVLIGNSGYSGIRSIANEAGGDGTVRIAGANLNALKLELEFTAGQTVPSARLTRSAGDIAFGVLDRENHSSIIGKFSDPGTERLIVNALRVNDSDYPQPGLAGFAWQQQLAQAAPASMDRGARFQNTVVHLRDSDGHDVPDYFFEFFRKDGRDDAFEQRFYEQVIGKRVHPHRANPAYRCFHLDVQALANMRAQFLSTLPLLVSVAASPEFNKRGQRVGYSSFNNNELGRYSISPAALDDVFVGGRSLLIRISIPRQVDRSVFEIKDS